MNKREQNKTGTDQTHFFLVALHVLLSTIKICHVKATKSYQHFRPFAGDGILCSNFFCFLLLLDVFSCFYHENRITLTSDLN